MLIVLGELTSDLLLQNQKHWWTSSFWNSKTETRLFSLFYEETIPNTMPCKGIPPKVLFLLCQEAMGFFVLEKSSNALTSTGTCKIPLWQSGDRIHDSRETSNSLTQLNSNREDSLWKIFFGSWSGMVENDLMTIRFNHETHTHTHTQEMLMFFTFQLSHRI